MPATTRPPKPQPAAKVGRASPDRQPAGRIRTGVSGWTYEPWRGVFYPKNVSAADELSDAALP